jgi:hypothetical protein
MKSEGGCGPPHLFFSRLRYTDDLITSIVDGGFHRFNVSTRMGDSGGSL